MIHINLIPYRQARRQKLLQKILLLWGVTALAGMVLALGVDTLLTDHIAALEEEKNQRAARIVQLDAKLGEIKDINEKKKQVENRLNTIENLKKGRELPVHILDEISNAIPEKVWISNLTTRKDRLTLIGTSQSHAEVAEFMDNLERSDYFAGVNLGPLSTVASGIQRMRTFTLDLSITSPSAPPAASLKVERPKVVH